MQKVFRLDKVAEALHLQFASTIVPGGIYFGSKGEDDNMDSAQFPIYINTKLVSDTKLAGSKEARVEFTIIGHHLTAPADLLDVVEQLSEFVLSCDCIKVFDFDGFRVEVVRDGSLFGPGYDLANRVILKKDYVFTYFDCYDE